MSGAILKVTLVVASAACHNAWVRDELPGDPLIGQSEAHLRPVAAASAAEAGALERPGLGDLRIDTDGRTPAEVADLVARRR